MPFWLLERNSDPWGSVAITPSSEVLTAPFALSRLNEWTAAGFLCSAFSVANIRQRFPDVSVP